jgi:Ca2+-transporting ATPase
VITVGLLLLLSLGTDGFGGLEVARSVAFTSFSLCLIVAALECRSETGTVLTTDTFDSKQLNWTLLAEFALAVLVTQMDVFNRLLYTTPITLAQFVWEAGKAVVRRADARHGQATAAGASAPRHAESRHGRSIPVPRGRT